MQSNAPMGRLVGYARVSKTDDSQTTEAQAIPLRRAGCQVIFEEKASGACVTRRELGAVMATLERGDTLVVARLDRFSRSLAHLLQLIAELENRGVGLKALDFPIDTTTPAGRLMVQMVGAFAEYERSVIVARTHAGLEVAAAKGHRSGPKPKLSALQRADVVERIAEGRSSALECARLYKVDKSTITRLIARGRRQSDV